MIRRLRVLAHRVLVLGGIVMLVVTVVGSVAWNIGNMVFEQTRERSAILAREAQGRVYDRLYPPIGDLPQRRPKQRIGLAKAEALLGDFWHHAQCDFSPTTRTRLFFFGSRKLDETGIVILVTTGPANDQVVSLVVREDNERLFLYDGCTDLDLSVTKRPQD